MKWPVTKGFHRILLRTHQVLLDTLNFSLSLSISTLTPDELRAYNITSLASLRLFLHQLQSRLATCIQYNFTTYPRLSLQCSSKNKLKNSFFRVFCSEDVILSGTSESSVKSSAIKLDKSTGTYLSGELSIPSRRNTQIPSLLLTKEIELGGTNTPTRIFKYQFTRIVSL